MLAEGTSVYNQLLIRYIIGRIETSYDFSTWKMFCPRVVTTEVHEYLIFCMDILTGISVSQELRLLYQLINVPYVFYVCAPACIRYIFIIYVYINARSDYLL